MIYAKFRYRVLCEDVAQYNFVMGWLEKKGVKSPRCAPPVGDFPHAGSGKAYVRDNFSNQLDWLRRSRNQNVVLIVVQDADNETVEACLKRYPLEDGVFLVIPKWSIETWMKFLASPAQWPVPNEDTSYKVKDRTRIPWKKLGRQLADMSFDTISILPSLKSTWNRIEAQKAKAQ